MKTLILTEKPSVAKDFAKALSVPISGNGFFENDNTIITWAIGHLMELLKPDEYDEMWKKWSFENLPILPDRLRYKTNLKTKKQLSIILKCLKNPELERIVLATDAGREGELIGRTILDQVKKIKTRKIKVDRFWTSQALSKNVIFDQLQDAKPIDHYDRLYYAARARQSADWLVGMNLSRLATLSMNDTFSVGRVQTAVLALLVRRKDEIDRFKSEKYFIINGEFNFKNSKIASSWFMETNGKIISHIKTLSKAQEIVYECQGKDVVVDKIVKESKRVLAPQLYSLTELQKVANLFFGFSAIKTLNLAQALYERHKCLSYPRTDSRVLGSKSFSQVTDLISIFKKINPDQFKFFNKNKLQLTNKRVFNDQKLTDHHALIPLKNIDYSKLNSEEEKIFKLILKRFIKVFLDDYQYLETKIIFKINQYYFKSLGHEITCLGWKSLQKQESNKILPKLDKNEIGKTISIKEIEKNTTPPSHYTEATLLQDMLNPSRLVENQKFKKVFRGDIGLGTQATRAQIIETLLMRKYVIRDHKFLIAMEKGIMLVSNLNNLKVSRILTLPEETAIWEMKLEDIALGSGNVIEFMQDIRKFVSDCTSEWKASSLTMKSMPNVNKDKILNTEKKSIIASCPRCKGNGQIIDTGKSFSCNQWKSGCKFVIWKKIAKKSISQMQAKKIIKNGKSDLLKGFKSKSGKSFNAFLVMKDNGIEFTFESDLGCGKS